MTPGHTLELGGPPASVQPPAPFAVVFSAPRGETRGASEVTIVFNRPMRALDLHGEESASPARIAVRGSGATPKGRWQWMGTSALVFVPEPRLPDATEYVVTVPAGTRSLGGEPLAEGFEQSFSTPRPRIERVTPEDGDHQLLPATAFEVRFDQPVDPRDVEQAATLTVGEGKGRPARARARLATRLREPEARTPGRARGALAARLEGIARVRGVTSRHGGSVADERAAHRFSMATYGPLGARVHCWNDQTAHCRPGVSFSVDTTNRVSFAELRSHLRISPPAEIAWSKTRADDTLEDSFSVPAVLRAGTRYVVSLAPGMKDESTARRCPARSTFPSGSTISIPPSSSGWRAPCWRAATIQGRSVPVVAVNTGSFAVATGALDEQQVADLVCDNGRSYERPERLFARVSAWPGVRVERVTPGGGRNVSTAKRVPIEPVVASRGGRGAFFIATERELRVGDVTDLGLTAKMSRFGSLVWVTRLSDGRPVVGATVSILDHGGVVVQARTDTDGLVAIAASQYEPADADGRVDGHRLVTARLGDDWTWRQVGESYAWGGDGVYADASGRLDPLGMLFTDRGVYRPGETVEVEAIFRLPRPRGTETPSARALAIEATDAHGEKVYEGAAKLDDFGVAAFKVPLPATAHLGGTTIHATMDGEQGSGVTAEVQLAAYKASEFKVGVDAGAPSWVRGADATFDVHGDYLFGAPMAGAHVRWNVTRARGWFSPPGHEDFVVDDDAYERDLPDRGARALRFQNGEGALDSHGAFAARVPPSTAAASAGRRW